MRGNYLLAVNSTDNSPVWQDSCVEFFVQIPGEKYYYNFEFNCIGTALAARRTSRSDAEHFSPEKMVTAFDVKYGKPNPEPYLMGLEKAGVNANEAIVVENAPMGVQAGVAAGIFTIAVNTGPLSDEVLLQAGADLLFSSVSELAEKWDEIVRATQQVSLL